MTSREDQYSEQEWQARVDLAAFFRLVANYGWDDLLLAHISLRLEGEAGYLVNPFGLLFREITASSLLKVNYQGEKLEDSEFNISPEANVIHGGLLQGRTDINCVAHVHTVAGTAVSSKAEGLKNISQQSMIVFSSLAYHDFEGIVLDPDEGPGLVSDLSDKKHMILRNHGLLTVGPNVSATFQNLYNLQRACEMQVAAESGGGELLSITPQAMAKTGQMIARMGNKKPARDFLWEAKIRELRETQPDFER